MFEYLHIEVESQQRESDSYPDQEIEDTLNEFGRNGWELVAIVPDWVWDYTR